MSDWLIQQSNVSSDKVIGPLTSQQVVALFLRKQINKKTQLSSQKHTSNQWILLKDSVLWPVVLESIEQEKEKKIQEAAQQKKEKEEQEERARKEQQREREEIEENRRQQMAKQQAAQAEAQRQAAQIPPLQGQENMLLVTTIPLSSLSALEIVANIMTVVGVLSISGGGFMVLYAFVELSEGPAQNSVAGTAIGAMLYGVMIIGLAVALNVFGRMARLLEQNTQTLLRILERS